MFLFDKDMERIMLAKKKELLAQIEDAKERVLKELYCVKRSVHTDLCEMLADYNRIDFNLKKTVADLKQEVKSFTDSYKEILASAINGFNTQLDMKYQEFSTTISGMLSDANSAIATLEIMQETVEGLIARVEQYGQDVEGKVDKTVFDAFVESATEALANAGVQSDWNENDPENKAFINNRTHYVELKLTVLTSKEGQTTSESELQFEDGFILEVGKEYLIDINGQLYTKTCYDDGGYPTIGASYDSSVNEYMFNENNPFIIYTANNITFFCASTLGDYVVKICEGQCIYHKLDPKFIPDSVSVQSDWNENDETSKAFVLNRTHYREGNEQRSEYSGKTRDYWAGMAGTMVFPVGKVKKAKLTLNGNQRYDFDLSNSVDSVVLCGDYGFIHSNWQCAGDFTVEDGRLEAATGGIAILTNDNFTVIKDDGQYNQTSVDIHLELYHGLGGFVPLDARFVVSENNEGVLLAYVDGKIVTVDNPFSTSVKQGYNVVYDGQIPYLEDDGSNYVFQVEGTPGYDLYTTENANGRYNYIWLSHWSGSFRNALISSNAYCYFSYSKTSGKIVLKIPHSKIIDENFETNGAYLKVAYPTEIIKSTNCILTSPGGSKFEIVVSDDGTLSTTPIT